MRLPRVAFLVVFAVLMAWLVVWATTAHAQVGPDIATGMAYDERIAWGAVQIAHVREIAREYCGQPYFGTVCS